MFHRRLLLWIIGLSCISVLLTCVNLSCSTTPSGGDSRPGGGDTPSSEDAEEGRDVADIQDEVDGDANELLIAEAEDLDAWFAAVCNRPDGYEPEQATYAEDLIHTAYEDGSISEEEYYVQCLWALYDPDKLDSRFEGEPTDQIDGTSLMRKIDRVYEDLSPETQELLQPYMLSYDDENSAWYEPDQVRATDSPEAVSRIIAKRTMERPLDSGDYFDISFPAGSETQHDLVSDALEHAYDVFADLGFPEPTDWIRVQISDSLPSNINGDEVFRTRDDHRRCHIRVKSTLDNDRLQATTAHELFHCFQEYVEADSPVDYAEWVWESSAVWSQEFAYPTTNTEHSYDNVFFSSLNEFLFDLSGVREYGSYPFWFHIYQNDGKTGEEVKQLYINIQEQGTLEAIAGRAVFYEEFKEYALWNINARPFKYYEDEGGMPTGRPRGNSVVRGRIHAWEDTAQSVFVSEGGIRFYTFSVEDQVDRLAFDLSELKKTDENQNGIQVAYMIDGEWTALDVSYRDELVFCRGRDAERVEGLIFVMSNSNLDMSDPDSAMGGNLGINTVEVCPQQWRGYVECTWNNSGEGDGRTSDLFVLGDYTNEGIVRIDEVLIEDVENNVFYATEQSFSQSSRYEWYYEPRVPTVDVSYNAWERKIEAINVSNSRTFEQHKDCPPDHCWTLNRRIRGFDEDDREHYVVGEDSFAYAGPYVSIHSIKYVPGSLGILQGRSAEISTTETEHEVTISCPREAFELTRSADGLTMSGSYSSENVTCEAEYTFE